MEVGNSVKQIIKGSVYKLIWLEVGVSTVLVIEDVVWDSTWSSLREPIDTLTPDPHTIKKSAKRFICPPTDEI